MFRTIIAALALLLPATVMAQTTTTVAGSNSDSFAGVVNVIGGGQAGGNGGSTANINTTGTTWLLGGTPSMSAVSYDACTQYISASAIVAGISIPIDKETCWGMRQAREMATSSPPGSIQYAHNCLTSRDWTTTDWETGTMACPRNKDRLRRESPNDPRVAATTYPAVVFAGAQMQPGQVKQDPRALSIGVKQAPPTVAPVAAPTYSSQAPRPAAATQIATLPRCSATVRDRCISG